MATNYPGSLDDFATTSPSNLGDDDSKGRTHSERHNDMESAMEAVQAELGTDPSGGAATVKARLEAAERGLSVAGGWWSSGAYAINNVMSGQDSATCSLVAGRQYYCPWWCPVSVTVDRMAVEVTTLQSGANARLGIYGTDATTGGPGALVLNAGEIDCSTTSVKELTISQALSGGTLYWLSLLNETTNVSYTAINGRSARPVGQVLSTSYPYAYGLVYATRTYTSGLIDPAPTWGTLATTADFTPLFWLRRT